jgi:uncharacterized protein
LMLFTFQDKAVFWYFFSATLLLLILIAVAMEELDDQVSVGNYITIGIISGVFLFALFWLGNQVIEFFHLPLRGQISALYKYYSPSLFWHYLFLMVVVVPGEEIFWRGFIQKRLISYTNNTVSIFLSAIMYTSVHLYASHFMLPFAALTAGIFWGWLYAWKRSIPLVIVSHLIFDLFLFVLMPFR